MSDTILTLNYADAVGSVAFHPLRSLILSVSGSRHFSPSPDSGDSSKSAPDDSESESDEDSGEDESNSLMGPGPERRGVRFMRERLRPAALDATVKLWGFAHEGEDPRGKF